MIQLWPFSFLLQNLERPLAIYRSTLVSKDKDFSPVSIWRILLLQEYQGETSPETCLRRKVHENFVQRRFLVAYAKFTVYCDSRIGEGFFHLASFTRGPFPLHRQFSFTLRVFVLCRQVVSLGRLQTSKFSITSYALQSFTCSCVN